jgi:Neuraminidase (sialidase)
MLTVRSKDYGRTWDGANPVVNAYEHLAKGTENAKALSDLGPVNYFDKNVLLSNYGPDFGTPKARTLIRISRDRGHTWSPGLPLAMEGLHSLSSINSVLVRPDGTVFIWLFEVGLGGFDRHPLIYALPPGGTEFRFMTFITPKEDPYGAADGDYSGTLRFGGHRWFYPRGTLLPNGRMLCTLRAQRDPRGDMWTEVFYSDDGGNTWAFLSRVNDFGSPGVLVRLPDGRLVMVYGYRLMPSGIRAKVSEDEGKTWGAELIVRDDGGSWDVGYPNAWVTDDGKVGVIYYFNSKNDKIKVNGGVRHICRSIFSVD